MNTNNILHNISHLKWVFLTVVIILTLYSFINRPENLISIVGLITFLAGIQMGLDSLSDVKKLSLKEQKRYKDKLFVKIQRRFILFSIAVLFLISTMFISLKFIFPSSNHDLFNEFFNLGLDCWALILGLLCLLKSSYDKHSYVNSLTQQKNI